MREVGLRALERVNAEVLMNSSGHNVKRLLEFGRRGPRKMAQAEACARRRGRTFARCATIARPVAKDYLSN